MGICKFKGGDRKQKYNEKVALNRASQPWSQKKTTHKGRPLRHQNTGLLTLKSYLELNFHPQTYDWVYLLPVITQSDHLMTSPDAQNMHKKHLEDIILTETEQRCKDQIYC